MRFFEPLWLWGILILPLFYFLAWRGEKRKKEEFGRFANRRLWPFISPEMDPDYRLRKMMRYLFALAFALLALARPQLGTHEETIAATGLDIMLALDVSNSMWAEDVVPSRLQKAKHVVQALLSHLDGDRVGAVAFAGSAYVACPLTTDLSYLWDTVQILGPRMIQNQGTDVGIGLDTAIQSLDRGGEESLTSSGKNMASHVVLLVSDGEDHEEKAMQIASKMKEAGVKLYILGVGTEKGGPIPLKDDVGSPQGFKRDQSGKSVVSAFRPEFLKKLAEAAGGKFWSVTAGEGEVQDLLRELGTLNRGDYADRKFKVYEERYQIPLAIAIVLLLLELSVPARKLAVCILFLASSTAFSAMAEGSKASPKNEILPSSVDIRRPAPLEVYLDNKKGIEAYKDEQLDEALKSFGAAQARDPSRPELYFNQGAVYLKKGEVDSAVDAFKSSMQSAQKKKDLSLQGKALYNLGQAYSQKGDIKNAARSYLEAIQTSRETKDSVLEQAARKNLQLLTEQEKKQKQQQESQKQKEQKEKEQQQKQESAQKKDSKEQKQNESSGQEKKDQQKNASQDQKQFDPEAERKSSRQKFQSGKMSSEDADRVMAELKARERELQERLQTRNAKTQNHSKDW